MAAVVLVPACGLVSTPEAGMDARGQGGAVNASDDYYYFDGKPVRLERAADELVIGVSSDTDVPQLLLSGSYPASAGRSMLSRGRRFVLVRLNAGASRPSGDAARLLSALRSSPGVFFASPIYYQPASRVRVIPTDEIVCRLKTSVTAERLSEVLRTHGLREVSSVLETPDQYLLRMASDGPADVLRVARELFETGLFQWVEPDFIAELRRGG